MRLKSDAKFKEKLTCGLKYDLKNLVNFHPTTWKSKNVTSMGYFYPKYMTFQLKKYTGVIFQDTEQWFKIWVNPDLVVSKMTWGEFSLEHSKSWKIVHWWALSWALSVGKFQRNSMSWHWRVMQNLKGNWHVAWKIT